MTTMTAKTSEPNATVSDWAGSPLSTLHYVASRPHSMPVEQYPDGASYVFRLEIPGIDLADDLSVSVEGGILSVRAERRDHQPRQGRETEFRYGSFARHVALPLGTNTTYASASYHNGILTARIGLQPEHQHGHSVRVTIEP